MNALEMHGRLLCGLMGLAAAACGGEPLTHVPYPAATGARTVDSDADSDGGVVLGDVCASCEQRCEELLPIDSALHVEGAVPYADRPPVAGMHNPCWGDYGVYSTEAPLPPERWVHNLEHGAIVWLYHCPSGCDAEVQQLQTLVAGHPRTLLTPYEDMPPGFAAVAWGVRLVTTCLDPVAFEAFYQAHFDRGRESVTGGPPAACQLR